MKGKKDCIEMKGSVTKCIPGGKFLVKCEEVDLEVTCSLSGKLRQNKIRIVEHDVVDIQVSVYDLNNGRIVWRY